MKLFYAKLAVVVGALAFLISPLTRNEPSRGLASLDLPAASSSVADPAFLASYNSFYNHFLGASGQWLSGLEEARGFYGLKSPLFSDPAPISIQPFKLGAPSGWFQTNMWSGLMGSSTVVSHKPARRASTIPVVPLEITTAAAPAAFSAR
ncbi:MAG: hypothetical protein HUU37_01095 [Bdellovibrionales bacterium]|nr:hypothetical protein [Bdellovibrionales bacterium]